MCQVHKYLQNLLYGIHGIYTLSYLIRNSESRNHDELLLRAFCQISETLKYSFEKDHYYSTQKITIGIQYHRRQRPILPPAIHQQEKGIYRSDF